MPVILDSNNFDSLLLDTNHVGYIAENFSYLIQNLIDFVDPKMANAHKQYPEIVGGQRRIVRAMRGSQLGYQYQLEAGKFKTASGGSRIINAFGSPIMVEEWTVSHPHVVDSDLGEEYPTSDRATKKRPAEARGPYTCLVTARISLSKQTPTRCYVQCNCKDFQTTFYEKLNKQGYTNAQSLPQSTGKKTLAPAICKHLYAIYSQHYTDIVNDLEHFVVDENPTLFGLEDRSGDVLPPTPPPTIGGGVAFTKEDAIKLIRTELQKAFDKYKNDPGAYFDPRVDRRKFPYHKYMFMVIQINKDIRGIAYVNKNLPGLPASTAPFAVLNIPNNPKIWATFFSRKPKPITADSSRRQKIAAGSAHEDAAVLKELFKGMAMPPQVKDSIEKKLGRPVQLSEDVEYSMTDFSLLETKNSNILSSMSELS